jgi:hypothetical protein
MGEIFFPYSLIKARNDIDPPREPTHVPMRIGENISNNYGAG